MWQMFLAPAVELFRFQTLESAFAHVNPKNLYIISSYPDNRQPHPSVPSHRHRIASLGEAEPRHG